MGVVVSVDCGHLEDFAGIAAVAIGGGGGVFFGAANDHFGIDFDDAFGIAFLVTGNVIFTGSGNLVDQGGGGGRVAAEHAVFSCRNVAGLVSALIDGGRVGGVEHNFLGQ